MVSCVCCRISIRDPATFLDQEVVEPLSQMGAGIARGAPTRRRTDGAPHNSFRIIVSPSAVPADARPSKSDDCRHHEEAGLRARTPRMRRRGGPAAAARRGAALARRARRRRRKIRDAAASRSGAFRRSARTLDQRQRVVHHQPDAPQKHAQATGHDDHRNHFILGSAANILSRNCWKFRPSAPRREPSLSSAKVSIFCLV